VGPETQEHEYEKVALSRGINITRAPPRNQKLESVLQTRHYWVKHEGFATNGAYMWTFKAEREPQTEPLTMNKMPVASKMDVNRLHIVKRVDS